MIILGRPQGVGFGHRVNFIRPGFEEAYALRFPNLALKGFGCKPKSDPAFAWGQLPHQYQVLQKAPFFLFYLNGRHVSPVKERGPKEE